MKKQTIAEENKILRSYLREIHNIVGHGSTFSDACPAEMLAVVAFEVAREINKKNKIIEELRHGYRNLLKDIDALNADLTECRINLREADAQNSEPTDKYGLMIGRIGHMIPVEFYRTPESTVEQAVALLLERYYSEMAGIAYNQNQKLENQ